MTTKNSGKILAGMLIGSPTDLPIAEQAKSVFENFKVPFAAEIRSAHRAKKRIPDVLTNWIVRGCQVIAVFAGWGAILAGDVAGQVIIPVISVPISSSALKGLDALLASVQAPSGVPVMTLAIDCGANAAYAAIQILALSNPELAEKLQLHRDDMEAAVLRTSRDLHVMKGWPA